MLFGMLRGDRCVAVYVHGPQGQVLGAFGLKTIQKINCKEIKVKIKKESRIGEAIIVQNHNLASYLQKCYIIRKEPNVVINLKMATYNPILSSASSSNR